MIRLEFVRRKLQLIADDLTLLLQFKNETLESITKDHVRLAAVERIVERIVMRAVDVNEHIFSELATGKERSSRLAYRDTFLVLAEFGIYPKNFADQISKSAGLRNILVHDYNDIDRKILHGSIRDCLIDYHRYLEYLSGYLDSINK